MQEAQILTKHTSTDESHAAQWAKQRDTHPGLKEMLEFIEKPQGLAIIFSHDDPDGITSGMILKRALIKKGWQVAIEFPNNFMLSKKQYEDALAKHKGAKAVFMTDKGCLPEYAEYTKVPLFLIDHHPSAKPPAGCTIYNPALVQYLQCSTSLLTHGISTLLGTRERYDDFLCLLGLKGDWAIEPVTATLCDFAKPFFVEYGRHFKNLLGQIDERPTQFDASQRTHTCLLSRITEYVHATGGGGFNYFYHDRHPSLKDVDHAACIGEALDKIGDKANELAQITTLESFVKLLPETNRILLDRIFKYFLQDWEKAERLLDSSVRIAQLGKTGIYLFTGGPVPLLPMIGSIKLFDLRTANHDETAQIIMVSAVNKDYTHVSVRATSPNVHSGFFCTQMQNTLRQRYPGAVDKISGGGHPFAAECTIKVEKPRALDVLDLVIQQLREMTELDAKAREGSLNKSKKERCQELGLHYLKH